MKYLKIKLRLVYHQLKMLLLNLCCTNGDKPKKIELTIIRLTKFLGIENYQNYPNRFRFTKVRTKYFKVGLNFLEVDYLNFHNFSKSEPILIILYH